ncbi:putative HAD superfamily Cof-like phosphohydrolase [Microvirga flocculans]|uniref:Putative HAD superfamily Cof-like phosphohydrolase n=1 Tax=Microvirga flocculans TaxID=217168 RepID=A0A7W6N756_9HYPH|nr:hypothetical protein [Microvirga flocculans]MBB4039120.1 putative HAD superfamily Cof-like phosphohydrolase [Microvirga flocculans]
MTNTDFFVDTQSNVTASFNPAASVAEFIQAFEMPPSVDLWLTLVDEERLELLEAMAIDLTDDTVESLANVLKEAADLLYVSTGLMINLHHFGLAPTDAAADEILMMLTRVVAVVGEDNFAEAFRRVHASNMSKLGDDGKPVRREDGKVLKGPSYAPPVLTDLVVEAYGSTSHAPGYLVG